MSFRKKARPIIAVSAVSRARVSKSSLANVYQEEKEVTDSQCRPIMQGQCDNVNQGPKVDNDIVEPLKLETNDVQGVKTNQGSESTPSTTPKLVTRRFKKFKPTPILSNKRPQQEPTNDVAKNEESSATPIVFESEKDAEVSGEVKNEGEVSMTDTQIEPKKDHSENIREPEIEPTLLTHDVGDNDGNPTGFIVTESKIADDISDLNSLSEIKTNNGELPLPAKGISRQNDSRNSLAESEQADKPLDKKSDIDDNTHKRITVANRFKRRKPVPRLTPSKMRFGDRGKNDKEELPASFRDRSCSLESSIEHDMADEKSKPIGLPEEHDNDSTKAITENISTEGNNVEQGESSKVMKMLKVEDQNVTREDVSKCPIDSSTPLLKRGMKNRIKPFLGLARKSTEIGLKDEDGTEYKLEKRNENNSPIEEIKNIGTTKTKRVRFRPNLTPKVGRNRDTGNEDMEKTFTASGDNTQLAVPVDIWSKEEQSTGTIGTEDLAMESKHSLNSEMIIEKHVRFEQHFTQEIDIKMDVAQDNGDCMEGINNGQGEKIYNRKEADIGEPRESRMHAGSQSDPDDGSQSEGEGIHHHGKRKFAPCLGPRVRQRRRLSSMNLSEDEGHMLERNAQDPHKIADMSNGFKEKFGSLEPNTKQKSDENAEKKKQKRKRIVIKEPKEKMTMFDYIYYNPKCSEEEKAEKEAESKQKKRLHEESTKNPESEIVLGLINGEPLDSNKTDITIEDDGEGDEIIAPQIKIGEDGQIIVDEQSLLLKTTRSKFSLETSEIVYTDSFNPYQRRNDPIVKKKWPVEETLKFYRILSRIGTDFSFMVQFFPGCTRRTLKKKFKTEEKYNGDLIDRALKQLLPMDQALLEELKRETVEELPTTPKKFLTLTERGKLRKNEKKKNKLRTNGDAKSSLSREQRIVEEEIMTMEVAENVTI